MASSPKVKDGIPENVPGINSRAVPITLEMPLAGNHVILDIGGGRFAFYAHLQPGSLRVKLGDKVRRGQVLGLVGNSGNSTEPHLHFHIENVQIRPWAPEGFHLYSLASFQEVVGHGWGVETCGCNGTCRSPQKRDSAGKRSREFRGETVGAGLARPNLHPKRPLTPKRKNLQASKHGTSRRVLRGVYKSNLLCRLLLVQRRTGR